MEEDNTKLIFDKQNLVDKQNLSQWVERLSNSSMYLTKLTPDSDIVKNLT